MLSAQRWCSAGELPRPRRLVAAARERRLDVGLGALALVAAYVLKRFYSQAGATELDWVLAPTAALVSALSGSHFVRESGTGYVGVDAATLIVPGCAGVNFLIIAWLMLVFGFMGRWANAGIKLAWLVGSALAGYGLTLFTNALRIQFAIYSHTRRGWFAYITPAELHRISGILIYVAVLWLTATCVQRLLERTSRHCNLADSP